jgi:predicted negative regulator of RcsB-dependent stress response
MAEVKKAVSHKAENDQVVERAKDFWTKYSRPILMACGAVILIAGGWLGYKYLVKGPKEAKANEAVWKAQRFFELDSMQKALKGDAGAAGFEKVISQYGGTAAGNLAHFYADRVMNDKKQAIELYKELRKKYPATRYGADAPKYLAMLGVYETEE